MTRIDMQELTTAAAQSSSVYGDIAQNVGRHAEFVARAVEHQANVVVFPELSLTGYEPTLAAELAPDSRAEQIANQVEHGVATIVAKVASVAAGAVDADNEKSLGNNTNIEDVRQPGVTP